MLSILLKKKTTKLLKQSKIISQQEKAIENPNIFEKKLAITEHPKTS